MDIKLNKEDGEFVKIMKDKGIDVTRSEMADVGDIILSNLK